jgi:hypothetical protein
LAGRDARSVRILIKQTDPDVLKEWKWRGFSGCGRGIICTGETYKNVVNLRQGPSLEAPSGLFNSSLEGNTKRAKSGLS